ncbi:MAG: hypothetical protein IK130_00245 [Oscillospiraceae bacterium]|nr:hypothetical protein [Oscillospiraceae bacterium]
MYDNWKRKAAAFCAAALMLTGAQPPVCAEDSTKLRVMCMGDSITDGFWLTGGYRNTLCSMVTENGLAGRIDFVGPNWGISTSDGYDPNHAGFSGYSIDNIAQEDSVSGGRIGLSSFMETMLETHPADVIFLQIGTNDILSLYDLDHFGERLEHLVDMILPALPENGMLYLATLPAMDANDHLYISEYYFTVESMDAAVAQCNAQIKALAQKKKAAGQPVTLADVNGVLTKADLYDGVHPSEAGYQKLGEFWYTQLTDYLGSADRPHDAAKPGDINADGSINTADAAILRSFLLGEPGLTAEQASRADFDGDSRLTAIDLTLLKKAAASN